MEAERKRVRDWERIFGQADAKVRDRLGAIYGDREDWIADRMRAYRVLSQAFSRTFPSQDEAIVLRVPGRISIMGVHTDGQRSYKNYMVFHRETLVMAAPRDDDRVVAYNLDARFEPSPFRIEEELPPHRRGGWMAYIAGVRIPRGHWMNYVRAAVLILQDRFPDRTLRGMDLMVSGDIPLSAGLSSSSALVVATALATVALNELEISRGALAGLCGEGEWYVGTRGGAGDHAAQLFGKRDHILHIMFTPVTFVPFTFEYLPFPRGVRIVIVNSLKEARKAVEARNASTARAVAQWIGRMCIEERLSARLEFLCDLITPAFDLSACLQQAGVRTPVCRQAGAQAGLSDADLYRLLRSLPETMTQKELRARFHRLPDELEDLLQAHDEPAEGYLIRQHGLYTLAECRRGDVAAYFLKAGDMKAFGEMMTIAHNGDRRVSYGADGEKRTWDDRVRDTDLDRLIRDFEEGNADERERARLFRQPGGFGCSCEELDQLVDLSSSVDGVLGARLTGAGLGGCILVLAEQESVGALLARLNEGYYQPRGLPLSAEVCMPVEGGGFL